MTEEFIGLFTSKKVFFAIDIDNNTNFPEINTDKEILKRTLIKLVDNALKFTESGQALIGIKLHAEEVEFFVSDTGIGMNEKTIKKHIHGILSKKCVK